MIVVIYIYINNTRYWTYEQSLFLDKTCKLIDENKTNGIIKYVEKYIQRIGINLIGTTIGKQIQ